MAKAQVGDLIRIVKKAAQVVAYEVGGIYEVIRYSEEFTEDEQVVILGIDGMEGYVEFGEYVIHRKAGEEDSLESSNEPIKDAVNSPQHYTQGRVEVIDIIEDAVQGADPFEAVCQANILKYTLRYRYKNGVEDLRKSIKYTEMLVKYLERQ